MAGKNDNAKSGLMLIGGILLGIVALGVIFAPGVMTLNEEEVMVGIGLVGVLIGAFIA